jgi:hypothetical protein
MQSFLDREIVRASFTMICLLFALVKRSSSHIV